MGLWDMIRGAEKAQGGTYNPGIANQPKGGLSAAALGALRGVGIGKKNGGGRE
jgi:hypothetical protein